MPPIARRTVIVAAAATAALLAVPGAAFAHGVGGTSETVAGFIWLGVKHMLLSWDHLLFVGGVALIAGTRRRAAQLVPTSWQLPSGFRAWHRDLAGR
jgi:hydrogenase/urease accessory protein HupE